MSILKTQRDLEGELKFIYTEAAKSPLTRISNPEILKTIIDPTTGLPYDGMIFEGEFASLNVLNNNNRLYSEENYIQFLEILKKQIFSKRGVYGELEHPTGYATNWNNVSHKILDIWYDYKQKKVFGAILLLNTAKGLIPQEIIKSGGQIGVSARGGGSEIKNPDGTFTAKLKLLVTFDIVYHPGFTTAVSDGLVDLNENTEPKIIYEDKTEKSLSLYEKYINNSNQQKSFKEWAENEMDNLSESAKLTPEQKENEEKLINNKNNNESKSEKELSDAVDQDLKESQKQKFYNQMQTAQLNLGKKMKNSQKLGNSYFDNTAGFVTVMEEELK